MEAKHKELYMFEYIFAVSGVPGTALKDTMNLLDAVFDLGYEKGHQDAILESMMGEDKEK